MCSGDIFLGLLALLFPPLPVWVKRGICSADSIINILLCILGYVPGLLHAWYVIAKFPEPDHDYERVDDSERGHGRVTYVVVHDGDGSRSQRAAGGRAGQQQPAKAPAQQANMSYGTNNNTSAGSSSQQQWHDDQGAGPSNGAPPPSYAQVVAGDHKIQDQS